ncbi:hypothetical protein H257_01164 [Aphanomyces astaci]|uniref:Uncharacterized protein n=1 Tax=Aphanomyces astaci TaxID=112090 RepID=W4H8S7_APHAT|nr:hypothetical protein H257_01164 [Aphanomyces astaci]ETV87674.1 hypothetical protein H257_01164 [Aphanomyces astaci]|eukprot:XP_009822537.1 hypothetical protein H257_01164 [Aphanomyces astaci]
MFRRILRTPGVHAATRNVYRRAPHLSFATHSMSTASMAAARPVEGRAVAAATCLLMCAGVSAVSLCDDNNRDLSVEEVIALYEQVDANMRILAQKLMEALAHDIDLEHEKDEADRLSVEQRAIQMSDSFETLLSQVQDSVFRNHYVTKDQVAAAMQRMESGKLKLRDEEAETIQEYIRKLGRLRWECTGSRDPIRGRLSPQRRPKPSASPIPRDVVVQIANALIPSLTRDMELIVATLKHDEADLQAPAVRQRLAKLYLDASQATTERIALKYNVTVEALQDALLYFHDDKKFQDMLTALTEHQHQRFVELGL